LFVLIIEYLIIVLLLSSSSLLWISFAIATSWRSTDQYTVVVFSCWLVSNTQTYFGFWDRNNDWYDIVYQKKKVIALLMMFMEYVGFFVIQIVTTAKLRVENFDASRINRLHLTSALLFACMHAAEKSANDCCCWLR
jgi:hypothetical protein